MLPRRHAIACLCAALVAAASSGVADEICFTQDDARCAVRLQADPPAGEWRLASAPRAGLRFESDEGYLLELDPANPGSAAVWSVRVTHRDAQAFRVTALAYDLEVPLARVAAIFDCQSTSGASLVRRAPQLDLAIDVRPNCGIPLLMALDHYGRSALLAGLVDQTGTYRLSGRRVDDRYAITLARDEFAQDAWFTGSEFVDQLYVSTEPISWYDAACRYADVVDRDAAHRPLPVPPHAELPYYSTWYALGDKLSEEAVWAQAERASRIGCGNFLIFIGWSTCGDWFSSESRWGDYDACPDKFRDFADLVRRIRDELGMEVELWTAPTWIGTQSVAFDRMATYRSKWPGGDYDRNLDPRSPEARAHIEKQFATVAASTGIRGVYVDFADTLFNRNDADHPQEPRHFGTAYAAFLASMATGLQSQVDQPLIAMRSPYANLLAKRYANVMATSYTEGDWQKARMFAIAQRFVGQGMVRRADPLVWTKDQLQSRDEVGKALSAMMLLGPPGISMDLTPLSDEELARLTRWFSFYREHRAALMSGEFRPFGDDFHAPEMLVQAGDVAYAWISRWETSEIPLAPGTKHAYLFMALPEEVSFIARLHPAALQGLEPGEYRARWVDSSLESHAGWFELTLGNARRDRLKDPWRPVRAPRENWDFDPGAEGVPSLDIRRGGFLELHKL